MGTSGGIIVTNSPNNLALGLAAQTIIDPGEVATHFTASAGTFLAVLTYIPAGQISTLGVWVHTGGATGTGVNHMAIHTSAGVLVDQTGDMTTALSSSAVWASAALSGGTQSIAGGAYYVSLLTHFSSNPEIGGAAAVQSIPVINGRYPSVFLTAQASIPASFDPTAATRNSGTYYFTVS